METILQNSEAVNDNLSINEISEALSGFEVLIPGLRPFSLFPSFGSVPDKPELSETIDKAEDEAEPSKYTVADIFHLYWEDYIKENSATTQQLKTVDNILNCRTGYYGYNISLCDTCGHTEIYANSCRNRHCPSCQGNKTRIWADDRVADLLPVPYYHAVLTMSDHIFPMCLYNQKVIYDLVLSCSAETVKQFGRDPKWLGAEVGFFSMLHTWGQLLPVHLHAHIVIPGGGYDELSGWVWPKNKDSNFLFPIHAMADVYRGKFIEGLKKAFNSGELYFPEELHEMSTQEGFESWINRLVSKKWIAYVKKPFGGPEQVIRYVSKYTHRVAISNSRITSIDNGIIRFMYKNYKKKHTVEDYKEMWEETQLPAHEFIRRFLYHVLPPGFHRIRHYGFLSNGKKEKRQEILEYLQLENIDVPEIEQLYQGMPCPKCEGILIPVVIVDGIGRLMKGSFTELERRKQIIYDAKKLKYENYEWNTS